MSIDDDLDALFNGDNNNLQSEKVRILNELNSSDDLEDDFEIPTSKKEVKATPDKQDTPRKELIGVSPRRDLGEEADTSYRTEEPAQEVDIDDLLGIKESSNKFASVGGEDESEAPSSLDLFDEEIEPEDVLEDDTEIGKVAVESIENHVEELIEEPIEEVEELSEEVIEKTEEAVEEIESVSEDNSDEEGKPYDAMSLLEKLQKWELIDDPSYLDDPNLRKFYIIKLDAAEFFNLNSERIDYLKCASEINQIHSEVAIQHDEAIHLDQFNELIQSLQGYRNRVAELKAWSINDYFLKKKYIKDLENYLTSCSNKKSKEQREGDQLEHMRDLKEEFILSERFYHHVDWCFDALTHCHESLSRRVTIEQEKNKRISRGEEPYVQTVSDVDEHLPKRGPLFQQQYDKKDSNTGWKKWDAFDD